MLVSPGQFFWDIFPCHFRHELDHLNKAAKIYVDKANRGLRRQKKRLSKWNYVNESDFKTFVALMVASSGQS